MAKRYLFLLFFVLFYIGCSRLSDEYEVYKLQPFLIEHPNTTIKVRDFWVDKYWDGEFKEKGVLYLKNKKGEGEVFIDKRGQLLEIPNTDIFIKTAGGG